MRRGLMNATGEKEYVASGVWKCDKSPSGAHHWIIDRTLMTCRYCNNCKQMTSTNPGCYQPYAK
jgi:hypothetical protein